MECDSDWQAVRADSLSVLQNLGQPLSRVDKRFVKIPWESPVPNAIDMLHDMRPTRTKKCCKNPPPVDRIASEWYPIHADALKDLRPNMQVFGAPSRLDGRDPVAYRR